MVHSMATAHHRIGRALNFSLLFIAPFKPVHTLKFSLALRGLSYRRGHVLRSFVTLVDPLCFSMPLQVGSYCAGELRLLAGIAIILPQYHTP